MADVLPTCWIPEKPTRDAREILRYRMKLVRLRTQLMNMVHSYLSKQNLHAPCRSIWTVEGRRWLEGERLSYPHNEMKDYCLQLIDSVTEVIEAYDRKLRGLEIIAEEVELIETIPYVGYTRALTIALETGPILGRYFSGIARRRGRKIAKISLARKIAKGVYHMLKNNITFAEYKSKYLAKRAPLFAFTPQGYLSRLGSLASRILTSCASH